MAENIYIYHTSPNQKSVITKKTISDAAHPYGIFNITATLNAAKQLSDRAFKLYVRMNLHQDGHTYALSPAEIFQSVGMSDKRYRDAVNELIEKGFLVQTEKSKSIYYFYEFPTVSTDATTNRGDAPAKSNDAQAKSDVSSDAIGKMPQLFWEDNPAISGGEIVHNITSHTTRDNTIQNTKNNTFDDLLKKNNFCLGDCSTCVDRDTCNIEKSNDDGIQLDDNDLPF